MTDKVNLMEMSLAQLKDFCVGLEEKPFRQQQLLRWMYQFGVDDFSAMSDLRKDLRAHLSEIAEVRAPEVVAEQRGADGTIKWAFDVGDGQRVESVFIPETGRNTLCVSTQVGCPVGCAFCCTGSGGFARNLSSGEIIGQVWQASKRVGFSLNTDHKPITNVVMMGMGEPLLNLQAVTAACEILLSDYAFALSKRRVTISTVGIVPALRKITGVLDVALALSLHAPDDALRQRLVPVSRKYPLSDVLSAVRAYTRAAGSHGGRVTIEYTLIDGVNDSVAQARSLVTLLKDLPCKINLIPFNPFDGCELRRPSPARVERFYQVLFDAGFTVIKRATRGDDIAAACGQLAGRVMPRRRGASGTAPE